MSDAIERLDSGPAPGVEELRAIPTFSDLPDESVEWLASHMTAADLEPGEISIRQGDPAEHLFVILEGEMRGERDDGRVWVAHAGEVTGMLPFSRLTHYPGTAHAAMRTRVAGLRKELFPEMLQQVPALQGRLVNLLADRVRQATKADLQREKLMDLGKLSAGLAHELNNPASAARRAADSLRKAVSSVRSAALKLDAHGLPGEARVFLTRLECNWAKETGPQTALDSLERSDREEEFASWLEAHHVERPWDLATTLVDLGCTKQTLEEIEKRVPAESLSDVLIRITAAFTISRLIDEIESSTARMSELVRAVKEYSYMDQMPEQEVDIHQGLENTLIMLRYRLKHGIDIVREYDRTLPKICARGGELNQVWTNLITNAIDAMNGNGKLLIRTSRVGQCVLVEVVDNGSGIAPEHKARIFEPFFTTKAAGEGTGLGLEAVYHIVRNHGGDVSFDSEPGNTRFSVKIPIK